MIALQVAIRDRFARLDYRRSMTICWKFVLPLAIVDILVTAAVLAAIGEGGGG